MFGWNLESGFYTIFGESRRFPGAKYPFIFYRLKIPQNCLWLKKNYCWVLWRTRIRTLLAALSGDNPLIWTTLARLQFRLQGICTILKLKNFIAIWPISSIISAFWNKNWTFNTFSLFKIPQCQRCLTCFRCQCL